MIQEKIAMVKRMIILMAALMLALIFASCSGSERTYEDFIDTGAIIAFELGDIYDDLARNLFKAKSVREYSNVESMLESLNVGSIDAVLVGSGYVRQLINSGLYPDFEYFWIPEDIFVNKAAPVFHTEELRDKYNEWFAGIAGDGTWGEVVGRWINLPLPDTADIPRFEFTGENGTLRICDTGNYPPLSYYDGEGILVGFDMDMASRFAQYMGMDVEVIIIDYGSIVEYVSSGRADMSAATFAVTGEREQDIIFGEPSVIHHAVLIARKR